MVRAADDYIRVLIRRPHAYFFLEDVFPELVSLGRATPKGFVRTDGTVAPLPGVYLFNSDFEFEEHARVEKVALLKLLE